jgi:hypothetical protein
MRSHKLIVSIVVACVIGLGFGAKADPSQMDLEGQIAGGFGSASWFGIDSDKFAVVNGRFAAAVPVFGFARFQADFEAESTSRYCERCGSRHSAIVAAHLSFPLFTNYDFGVYGGFARINDALQRSNQYDYGYFGVEGRYMVNRTASIGWQYGYFDVVNGRGTLVDAWYIEANATLALGELFGNEMLSSKRLVFMLGYSEGQIAETTLDGESLVWGVRFEKWFIPNANVFLDYRGFRNQVEGLGTVWTEHNFMAGLRFSTGPRAGALNQTWTTSWFAKGLSTF